MTDPVLRQPTSDRPASDRRPQPPFTREQRGWMVAAFVAFVGVAILGPAVTAAADSGRALRRRTRRRLRRLGGGAVALRRRMVAPLR